MTHGRFLHRRVLGSLGHGAAWHHKQAGNSEMNWNPEVCQKHVPEACKSLVVFMYLPEKKISD